ncbi:MAG: hypothetical protein JST92_15030, partial [Deltaproteobacteria bacterium]|nr:hypothetical protein [Deltaproteobacteria bacterium]
LPNAVVPGTPAATAPGTFFIPALCAFVEKVTGGRHLAAHEKHLAEARADAAAKEHA